MALGSAEMADASIVLMVLTGLAVHGLALYRRSYEAFFGSVGGNRVAADDHALDVVAALGSCDPRRELVPTCYSGNPIWRPCDGDAE